MLKIFITITLIYFLASCSRLTEKHFKTFDTTAGGFINVQFDLNSNMSLRLIKIEEKEVSQNSPETAYEPDTTLVNGTWITTGSKIRCTINDTEDNINKAFRKTGEITKGLEQNHNQIVFPIKTDTILIYGLPCFTTKSTDH